MSIVTPPTTKARYIFSKLSPKAMSDNKKSFHQKFLNIRTPAFTKRSFDKISSERLKASFSIDNNNIEMKKHPYEIPDLSIANHTKNLRPFKGDKKFFTQ